MTPPRAEAVRREANRILGAPKAPRVLVEMVAAHQMLLDEALTRIAHLEAILSTTGDERGWPPEATGHTRSKATVAGSVGPSQAGEAAHIGSSEPVPPGGAA